MVPVPHNACAARTSITASVMSTFPYLYNALKWYRYEVIQGQKVTRGWTRGGTFLGEVDRGARRVQGGRTRGKAQGLVQAPRGNSKQAFVL
jgi:hypothetical protein